MDLTDEQKTKLSEWVAEGATLNDLQERLKSELEITITYLETRFLIADLGLELREEEEAKEEESSLHGCHTSGGVAWWVETSWREREGEKAEAEAEEEERGEKNPSNNAPSRKKNRQRGQGKPTRKLMD